VKYIDEFRRKEPVQALLRSITDCSAGYSAEAPMTFMEVCGTHTMTIARSGIRAMLPPSVRLISGPGCPVCVTPNAFIDHAVELARRSDSIITTFGDMMRVPGSRSSLSMERASGSDIRVVTSALDALDLAKKNSGRPVVFLGVGFETTAPTIAASLYMARQEHISNFFVLSAHKTMPPPMDMLSRGSIAIHGYLCPGHVSAVIGADAYRFLPEKYGIACVVAGFEPLDILQSIAMLAKQVRENRPGVEIAYTRAVTRQGNYAARAMMEKVFDPCDSEWRGLGVIPGSGLALSPTYAAFDAGARFSVTVPPPQEHKGCRCGDVLQATIIPSQCGLFGTVCTPASPAGPCMVSTEGTCAAYYKYLRHREAGPLPV